MTTAPQSLPEFILAMVEADEVMAKAAIDPHSGVAEWTLDGSIYAGHPTDEVIDYVYGEASAHIARHDPARVLAQCAAYRKIVEMYAPDMPNYGSLEQMGERAQGFADGWTGAMEDTLRALASIWSAHEQFDPGWAL